MADFVESELIRIRHRLLEYYTSAEADRWLNEPHIMLNGANAMDLIQDGRSAEVDRIIDKLDDDIYL